MGIEIERKFLVHGEPWAGLKGTHFIQGYLSTEQERTIRVRSCGDCAYITIKSSTQGKLTRNEYEYEIPTNEAKFILENIAQKPLIEKIRYRIKNRQSTWDVDVFLGENAGLVVAEIELASESQIFDKPDWLGQEVTFDKKYLNSSLVKCPYSSWVRHHAT